GKNNKQWRHSVACMASVAMNGKPLIEGPIKLDIDFMILRPKGHYGKKGLLASAPRWPITRPDRSKIGRAVEDAMTSIVWRDDAQVVCGDVRKIYADHGESAGAKITITPLEDSLSSSWAG